MNNYESQEISRAFREAEAIERSPLSERKENALRWQETLSERPEKVAERIRWLLNGDYGYGQQYKALQVVQSPRMNQVAALACMIALWEWHCSGDMARKAWKQLPIEKQEKVNKLIREAIEEHMNNQD